MAISGYMSSSDSPLEARVEAAVASWELFQSNRYIDVLREAEAAGVLGEHEPVLRAMEQSS
jgi:hypothetical protein